MSPRADCRWLTFAVTTAVAAGLTTLPVLTTTAQAAHGSHAATTTHAARTANADAATGPLGVKSTDTVGGLTVENSFVSSVGWVKPGDTYPSRILLTNTGDSAVSGAAVVVTAPAADAQSAARVAPRARAPLPLVHLSIPMSLHSLA